MMIVRVLAVLMMCAGATLGLPATATAAEPMQGYYVYSEPGVPPYIWNISPTCVQAGCVLHVAINAGSEYGTLSDRPGYGGDARPVNGLWNFGTNRGEGTRCPDGTLGPSSETYSWSESTLTGTVIKMHGPICGLKPEVTRSQFTLTYAGPLSNPVILDPLNQIPDKW